jgi:hypothetical protein
LSMWRSAEAGRSALTRQDAQVHPRGRGQVSTGPLVTSEALLYPAAVVEQGQPTREWRTKQLEAETTTASSRQS